MNSCECPCPSLLSATGTYHHIRVGDSNSISFILEQKSFPLSLPFIQCLPLLFSLKLKHKNINILGSASQRPVMPSIKLQPFHCQCSGHGASRSVPLARETSPFFSSPDSSKFICPFFPRLLFSSVYTLSLGNPTIFIFLYNGNIKKNHIYFHFPS